MYRNEKSIYYLYFFGDKKHFVIHQGKRASHVGKYELYTYKDLLFRWPSGDHINNFSS